MNIQIFNAVHRLAHGTKERRNAGLYVALRATGVGGAASCGKPSENRQKAQRHSSSRISITGQSSSGSGVYRARPPSWSLRN